MRRRTDEPRVIDGRETALVFQMAPAASVQETAQLAVMLLSHVVPAVGPPAGDTVWVFYLAFDRPQHEGRSTWLGMSKDVPKQLLVLLQGLLDSAGHPTTREYAQVAAAQLEPILAVTRDEVEIAVGGPCSIDPWNLDGMDRARVVPRRLLVDGRRADADAALVADLLGPNRS